MRKQPPSLTADPEIRATFQAQLAKAGETPGLSSLVTRPAPDLYPRYSDYYRQLCQLPRRVRRALQRQWKRSLSALALLLALGQAPALAATIHVDGTSCTLADAIRSANTNSAVGGCTPGSGADTLVLAPKSTHTLVDTGLPLVTSTITIAGRKSTIERGAGAPEFGLLAVSPAGKLTLEKLTVSGGSAFSGGGVSNNGTLILRNSTVSGNTADSFGGGIVNYGGSLTLTNSAVEGNTANDGGGVFNFGTLTLRDSTVSGNTAEGGGGGVRNHEGTLNLANSTVSNNTAGHGGFGGGGGGVDSNGTLALTNSTVSGNTAFSSGGGVVSGGTLTLTNSTVSGNKTSTYGGGVYTVGSSSITNSTISGNSTASPYGNGGGGVFNNYGTLTLRNSTISGNTAAVGGGVNNRRSGTLTLKNATVSGNTAYDGGGLYNANTLTLTNSTVSGNTAIVSGGGVWNSFGTLTLGRSLISGNTAASGPEVRNRTEYDSGTVNADDFNLFGHNGNAGVVGFLPGQTDLVPSEGLGAILNTTLANNGGPTRTHALVRGSPAIDAVGGVCPPPDTDQRGVRRPKGPACDIGAFEGSRKRQRHRVR